MIEMSSEKVAALVRSQAALGPVCNELARLDLEAMVGSSGFRVTARELAVRWGWSKSVVGRWLRQLDRFELAANPSGSRIRRVGEARDSQSPGSTPLPSRGGTRRRRRPLPPVPHPRKGIVPPLYPPPTPFAADQPRREAPGGGGVEVGGGKRADAACRQPAAAAPRRLCRRAQRLGGGDPRARH